MSSVSCGKGMFIFSITFAIGIFFAFLEFQIKPPQIEIPHEIMTPVQVKTQSSERRNLRCKEKIQNVSKMDQLSREILELNNQLSKCLVKFEEKQCRFYDRKIKEKFKQLEKVEKEMRQGTYSETESVHNLLYVENCVRY